MKIGYGSIMKILEVAGKVCSVLNIGVAAYFGVNRLIEAKKAEEKRRPIGFGWSYEEEAK